MIILIFGLKIGFWKLKMLNFCQVRLKLSYKMSKNPLRGLNGMQKTIEIQLPHYEFPQLHQANDDDVTRVKMKVLLAKQWHARWHDQKTARRWENNIKKVMTLGCQSCGYSSYNSSHRHTHAEMKIYNR